MSYGEYIYISSQPGAEEQLLQRIEPMVAGFTGDHTLRVKRGSGWVQLESKARELDSLEAAEPEGHALAEDEKACNSRAKSGSMCWRSVGSAP